MHSEQPVCLIYKGKVVKWWVSIGLGEDSHGCARLDDKSWLLKINLGKMYEDLISYLDNEIVASGEEIVKVCEEVEFIRDLHKGLENDFVKLDKIS